MSGRGAGDRPLTYAGEYDAARTYLAREVATSSGSVYMAIATSTGHAPPDATYWLPLGGDSDHPGSGLHSTQVGADAAASSDFSTAIGDGALADADGATAVGQGAEADGVSSTAVGTEAVAEGLHGTAVGSNSGATGSDSVAVGYNAVASGARSQAYGNHARATDDDLAVMQVERLRLQPEATLVASFVEVCDSDGTLWRIGVSTGGAVTVTAV